MNTNLNSLTTGHIQPGPKIVMCRNSLIDLNMELTFILIPDTEVGVTSTVIFQNSNVKPTGE